MDKPDLNFTWRGTSFAETQDDRSRFEYTLGNLGSSTTILLRYMHERRHIHCADKLHYAVVQTVALLTPYHSNTGAA